MSIDPKYQPLYNQLKQLRFQVHDAIDDHNHPTAQFVKRELQHLEDDIEMHKNPRDLENRVKAIEHSFLEARSNPSSFMSTPDVDHFHHTWEDMRQNIKRFDNYS